MHEFRDLEPPCGHRKMVGNNDKRKKESTESERKLAKTWRKEGKRTKRYQVCLAGRKDGFNTVARSGEMG